ncbi:MAG: periplasmic heavy metal sensor [Burkholderiales bacterium]
MNRTLVAAALLCLMGAAPVALAAGPASTPYAGEQHRDIKALSPRDVQDLLAGRGMGLAKSAELNGYPGPAHVLELSDRLGLTAEQSARTKSVFEAMETRARALGKALVEREAELERLFASRRITSAALEASLAEISKLQGELRRVHLEAHLAQTDILTPEQIAAYAELRGYGGADHSGAHRH